MLHALASRGPFEGSGLPSTNLNEATVELLRVAEELQVEDAEELSRLATEKSIGFSYAEHVSDLLALLIVYEQRRGKARSLKELASVYFAKTAESALVGSAILKNSLTYGFLPEGIARFDQLFRGIPSLKDLHLE